MITALIQNIDLYILKTSIGCSLDGSFFMSKMVKNKNKKSYSQKLRELEIERTRKRLEKQLVTKKPVKKKRKKRRKQKAKTKFQLKYYEYLQSEQWVQIRIEMLIKYPVCQRCGSEFDLQVHHKNYDHIFNEEPGDLEVLCKRCHKSEHVIT